MAGVNELGPFEIAPQECILSLRRKNQFAMIGPVQTHSKFMLTSRIRNGSIGSSKPTIVR